MASKLVDHLFREDRWQTWPNVISAVRILLLPVFVMLMFAGQLQAATIMLGSIFFTDFLDGFIARNTGTVSNLGTWLDPIADRLTVVVAALSLGGAGVIPWILILVLFIPDLILSAIAVIGFKGSPHIPVTWMGKWRTALLFIGMSLLLFGVAWTPEPLWLFDALVRGGLALFIIGLIGHFIAGGQYLRAMLAKLRASGASY